MREKANAKFEEPLTLEQLLEMNGKPVWTKLLVESTGRKEGWTLVYNDDRYAAVQRWTQFPLWYKDYGKTWLAYAYPPAHIDMEAWEPCAKCLGCGNCYYFLYDNDEYPCNKCLKESTDKNQYPTKFEPIGFCKHCGRPLTDEAWDELEKRMRGV